MPLSDDSSFLVQCTGQVESGDFGDVDNLYCRYAFHLGNDWSVISVSPPCVLVVAANLISLSPFYA